MSWTSEMVATVRDHWGSKSAREIGDMVGKSKNAVIGKADRLGLKRLAMSPKMRSEAARTSQRATIQRIAAVHARLLQCEAA